MIRMHEPRAFSVFATAIGDCALAWNDAGVFAVWLPEASAARLRSRIAKRYPQAIEDLTRAIAFGADDGPIWLLLAQNMAASGNEPIRVDCPCRSTETSRRRTVVAGT